MEIAYDVTAVDDRVTDVTFRYRNATTGRKNRRVFRFNQKQTADDSRKLVGSEKISEAVEELVSKKAITPSYLEATHGQIVKRSIIDRARRGKKEKEKEKRVATPKAMADRDLFRWDGGGKSVLIVGSSFSGKTHLYVEALNELDVGEYDGIVLMTESANAEPLAAIRGDLDVVVMEGWHPEVCEKFKALNDATDNRWRWLVILDDIVDQKHSSTLQKMVLTYRNSGITTAVVIQYPCLVSRASRGNFHEVVITGFRSLEDWDSACKIFGLLEWARDRVTGVDTASRGRIRKDIAHRWLKEKTTAPGSVIYIDQRHSRDPVIWEAQ